MFKVFMFFMKLIIGLFHKMSVTTVTHRWQKWYYPASEMKKSFNSDGPVVTEKYMW